MSKISTDKKLIEEVLTRGVENIYPSKENLRKILASGKRIRLYCGFDPSAPALHIGNAIAINKLSQFQELGHEVIFLVGDFTGMIGDPTDKKATRKKMTREEVLANAKNYKKQASAYLNFSGANMAQVKYNSEWNDKLTFKDLVEISSNFTVQQMLARDMFEKRYRGEIQCVFCNTVFTNPFFSLAQGTITSDFEHAKFIKCPKCSKTVPEMLNVNDKSKLVHIFTQPKPIYMHEFLYPLAQGYDSVVMDVDLEVGGNDQMFNMLCGRDLIKAIRGKEKFVLTLKLLADDQGQKMGKSEGNAVFLDQEPADMYGKIMSWADGVIGIAFELCTKLQIEEIEMIKEKLKDGKVNPRDLKMKLAREIVKQVYGKKEAAKAEEDFISKFQKKETPDEVRSKKLEVRSINIIELLVGVELAKSKGEARRLVEQGGIKIDGKVENDINKEIKLDKEVLIQRGKRQFVKVAGK